jgi:predicted Zn-dependent protease
MRYVILFCASLLLLPLVSQATVAQATKDVARGNYTDALLRDSYQVLGDEELTARVAEIGQKIIAASGNPRGYQYRFVIVNDAVPTAFCTVGYVYVTTGFLRAIESEDELAAVLGHEIAHLNERHPLQTGMGSKSRIFWMITLTAASTVAAHYAGGAVAEALGPYNPGTSQLAQLVSNIAGMATSDVGIAVLGSIYKGYSEDQEFKSDELALGYTSKAGYKPEALVTVFERLLKLSEAEILGKSISHFHSSKEMLNKRMEKAKKAVAK